MKRSKRIVSRKAIFLLIFMILTALHGVVLVYLYQMQFRTGLALIVNSQENMIEFEKSRIRTELHDIVQDLLFLAEVAENSVSSGLFPPHNPDYHGFFTLLGNLTQRYRSLRIISPGGEDLYRISFGEDGRFHQATDEELAERERNYYFQELKDNADTLYISRMRLVEENGVVREPREALISIGRCITDSSGESLAYIILDYRGDLILDQKEKYDILPESVFNSYLINNEGYLLSSPDDRPSFGFQFPHLVDETLAEQLPDVWLQLQREESGTMRIDGSLFVHRRIRLEELIPRGGGVYLTEGSRSQRSYFLVYETPSEVLRSISVKIIKSLIIPFIVTQLIILLLSLLLARWADRLQRYQQKLLHFSSMDEMTGCMNRRTGRKILENYLSLSRRRNSVMTVVYLDLNNLKTVNDKLGHREGDHYILTMVDLIREHLRNSDFFIRMGGDEFLLILPDCSREEALRIRKRVLVKEHRLNSTDIYPYTLGMSWGILELSPHENITVPQILEKADSLMYDEKSNYPRVDEELIRELEQDVRDSGGMPS